MAEFRKKPVVIEAMQFVYPDFDSVAEFAGQVKLRMRLRDAQGRTCLSIPTLEGWMLANDGDWIIRGIKGELYPCKPDIFEATYEPVAPSPAPAHEAHIIDSDAFDELEAALTNPAEPTESIKEAAKLLRKLYPSPAPAQKTMDERDIFEVANQLEGYIGPSTDSALANFLRREGNEAAKLADEIVALRTALSEERKRADAAEATVERLRAALAISVRRARLALGEQG